MGAAVCADIWGGRGARYARVVVWLGRAKLTENAEYAKVYTERAKLTENAQNTPISLFFADLGGATTPIS